MINESKPRLLKEKENASLLYLEYNEFRNQYNHMVDELFNAVNMQMYDKQIIILNRKSTQEQMKVIKLGDDDAATNKIESLNAQFQVDKYKTVKSILEMQIVLLNRLYFT